MTVDIVEAASFGVLALLLVASGLASALVKRTFHSVMFLGVFLVGVAALYVLLGSPLVGVIQILVYVGGILTLFVFAVMFVAGDEKEEMADDPRDARGNGFVRIAGTVVIGSYWAVGVGMALIIGFGLLASGIVWGMVKLFGMGDVVLQLSRFVVLIFQVLAVLLGGLFAWLGIRRVYRKWSAVQVRGVAFTLLLSGLLLTVAGGFAFYAGLVVGNPSGFQVAGGYGGPWEDAAATDANVAAANDLSNVLGSLFTANAIAFEILGVLLTAVMIGALVLARPLAAPADEEHYAKITPEQLRQSQEVSDVRLHAGGPPPASGQPSSAASSAASTPAADSPGVAP